MSDKLLKDMEAVKQIPVVPMMLDVICPIAKPSLTAVASERLPMCFIMENPIISNIAGGYAVGPTPVGLSREAAELQPSGRSSCAVCAVQAEPFTRCTFHLQR